MRLFQWKIMATVRMSKIAIIVLYSTVFGKKVTAITEIQIFLLLVIFSNEDQHVMMIKSDALS